MTTINMMPMQVAAKAPRVVICQDWWRKQASMVYQFQSIEILHAGPSMFPSPMSIRGKRVVPCCTMVWGCVCARKG